MVMLASLNYVCKITQQVTLEIIVNFLWWNYDGTMRLELLRVIPKLWTEDKEEKNVANDRIMIQT